MSVGPGLRDAERTLAVPFSLRVVGTKKERLPCLLTKGDLSTAQSKVERQARVESCSPCSLLEEKVRICPRDSAGIKCQGARVSKDHPQLSRSSCCVPIEEPK